MKLSNDAAIVQWPGERVNIQPAADAIVEWEVTMKCNYTCHYCTNLDLSRRAVVDRDLLSEFINELSRQFPNREIFLFGGEPFVHPEFPWIIEQFNKLSIPFVIQTNFSSYSLKRMTEMMDLSWNINISVHPTQVTCDEVTKTFEDFRNIFGDWNRIRVVDVMAVGDALPYYFAIKRLGGLENRLFYTPVTDFGDGVSDVDLNLYNQQRHHSVLSQIVQFENVEREGRLRSELWADHEWTTKGKPCLYKNRYFLYGSDLQLNTCCYRGRVGEICPHQKCFLM